MRFPPFLLTLLAIAGLANGDTITLATGEKITGTIKAQTSIEVVIDVPVSATITDERVIKKDDIRSIDSIQPDELEYQKLIALQPNSQSSYSSQGYQQVLDTLHAFGVRYPQSPFLPQIQKLESIFAAEKARVDAGQVKFLGEWLTKEEAARQAPQIQAAQLYASLEQQAASGDLVGAMQSFSAIEKGYPHSRSYPQAVMLGRAILMRFQQDLATRMDAARADQEQLRKTVDATAEPERSQIIEAAREEQARASAAVQAALRTTPWVPLIPRSQESIAALQQAVSQALPRLNSVPVGPMTQSIGKVDAARAALRAGDVKSAGLLVSQASQLWSDNDAARDLAQRLKAIATPPPTPTPGPAAPTPLSTPLEATAPTPEPAAAAKPFFMTIPGALAVAVAVLIAVGLLSIFSQRKARAAAARE